MRRYKFLPVVLAASIAVAGCTKIDRDRDGENPTLLRSIGVGVTAASGASEIYAGDPTMSNIVCRADAGAVLSVKIGERSGTYVYSGGKWVPDGAAVEFPGYGNSVVELTLSDAGGTQDGSAEGLLDADVLTHRADMFPAQELDGILMSHAKTLIQIQIEGELTIDRETKIFVGDAAAYNIPQTKNYQAIIEPGIDGFNITLTKDGVRYVIHTSKSQVSDGEFRANCRYRLLLTNVGKAIELKAITLQPWDESGEGTGRRLMKGTISLGGKYPSGTPVAVLFRSGIESMLEFDDPVNATTGSVWGIEGDVVRSIRVGGRSEILIGRAMGDAVTLALGNDCQSVTLRRDAQSHYLVGTIAEFRLIDGPGMNMESFVQESDMYLMDMAWSPLFDYAASPANFFKGTFDGNEKKIYGLSHTEGRGALFSGNDGGIIRNVHIASGAVGATGTINNAGICVYNLSGTIQNCTNAARIEGASWVAGICAINEGTVTGCVNRGDVTGYGDAGFSNAGGVVGMNGDPGYPNAMVENCTNYGLVDGRAYINGGIAASCIAGTIAGCVNEGEVRGTIFVGGMAGNNSNTVIKCTNNGPITAADGQAGGVIGVAYDGSKISLCVNNGTITSKGIGFTGGILSNATGTGTSVVDCINNGSVYGVNAVGGIVGYNNKGAIAACINTGTVNASNTIAGGIAGDNDNTIIACYNTSASVSARDIAGGITGYNGSLGFIGACYSIGKVTVGPGRSVVGGVAGQNGDPASKILNSYWAGHARGIGSDANPDETAVYLFSDTAWPAEDASANWGLGNDYATGRFWISLGNYDAENPVYPELSWRSAVPQSAAKSADGASCITAIVDLTAARSTGSMTAANLAGRTTAGNIVRKTPETTMLSRPYSTGRQPNATLSSKTRRF